MSPSFSSLNLVLLGPPGSGKGTQAALLAERYQIPHISTGDMLRDEVERGTTRGMEVEELVNNGAPVNDRLVAGLVLQRLDADDCRRGFVLDGFPRNAEQAALLDGVLAELGRAVERVLLLDVPDDMIIARNRGRLVHPGSGRTYHLTYRPPREAGQDDVTGEPLLARNDDRAEAIQKRLQSYHRGAQALIDFYQNRGQLVMVDGRPGPERVSEDVQYAVEAPVGA